MKIMEPKFEVGQVIVSDRAQEAFQRNNVNHGDYVAMHERGLWGDVGVVVKNLNDARLGYGGRLLSSYTLPDKTEVWVVTSASRVLSCVHLPAERSQPLFNI